MFVRVGRVSSFRIKDGCRFRQDIVGNVMVAYDEVYSLFFGIGYFIYCLYSAVKHNDKFYSGFVGIVHSLGCHSVSFVISVGDIIVDIRVELLEELIYQCHRSSSVYIIVAVYQDTFLSAHCLVEPFNGRVHVVHQERVVQVMQLWAEEFLYRIGCFDSSLSQQMTKYRTYPDFLCQSPRFFSLLQSRRLIIPFVSHYIIFFFFPYPIQSVKLGKRKNKNAGLV